ncbi:Aflatoxin biosynthesis regulatory protein [Penicillium maclennaniae]|uniref:Aflatoxin biosynthesis regulatory protein n=1 Tax=Penicillium maclennaniae TaxID=1343394 RepID=UPI0025405A0B|nr:Aflatoxin biosynthesis regulatory protein [Penicillium maclennaniae]KAJ5681758.1 Aflatoxin biosynthesis regulatory protein [Penicillium maclennaniae]
MRRVKKSRNGCARCKSKRVKCGEEKPHCSRCTRLGVRCPGYVQSLRWVTKHEQPSPNASDGKPMSPAAERTPVQVNDPAENVLPLDGTNARPSHDTEPHAFGLDADSNTLDNLWGLRGNASLPDLADLCPPSPVPGTGFSPRDSPFDFASEDTAADQSRFFSLIGPIDEEEQPANMYRDFSPSAIVRSYPPNSQRAPLRDFMSISRPLNNPSWTLIEYYFKEVAALFSSYDSQMNPFRTTVSRLWGSSLAMCRTMQSMAAATLVNDFPQFGPLGRKMRDEAVDIITGEAVMDDKSLLALLMLGQTASWHDPKDLGISFFNLLRKQLNSLSSSSECPSYGFVKSCSNNYRFFEEALIYWEMLLSFVTDSNSMVFSDSCTYSSDDQLVLQRVPHPWTGIAKDTQFTVHEVGRLVRRERKRVRSRNFTSQEDINRARMAIEKAQELEKRLLGLAHPSEAEIVSPGDDETPVWHLLTMAEVYRCTGLMQLYRVFPDLLRNRLSTQTTQYSTTTSNRDPFFPINLDSMNMSTGFSDTSPNTATNTYSNHTHTHTTPPLSSPPSIYHQAQDDKTPESLHNNWLTEFAITTISRLKTIPLESRTRCLQPFLLVASCSELRLPLNLTTKKMKAPTIPRNHQPYRWKLLKSRKLGASFLGG